MRGDPGAASVEDMERWVDLQGPRSPALLEAVTSSDADVLAFYPYLYYPTVRGLPLVEERAVMHPAAHEEAFLYLPVFDELFVMHHQNRLDAKPLGLSRHLASSRSALR